MPSLAPGREAPDVASLLALALNRDQLDFEDESGVGTDVRPCAVGAVSKIGRNEKLPLRPHGHELYRLRPPLDDSIQGKRGGLAALVGTIEFLAADERAAVVANDSVGGRGLRSRT